MEVDGCTKLLPWMSCNPYSKSIHPWWLEARVVGANRAHMMLRWDEDGLVRSEADYSVHVMLTIRLHSIQYIVGKRVFPTSEL
jgi:hypothetical protein